jgi:hypothetical protein
MSNLYGRGVLLLLVLVLGGCKLHVATEGGRGNVTSKSGLINCGTKGTQCDVDYSDYAGSKLSYTEELYAAADPGFRFSHWSGDCSGSGSCSVKLSRTSGDKSVSAVFVEEPLSTEKSLVSFRFLQKDNPSLPSDITATINESNRAVHLAVPTGVNLQTLVANFESTGVDVTVNGASQTSSETVNNFTNTVMYQVRAEDGSTQRYGVTVSQVDYQAKALTSFRFAMQDNSGFEQDAIGEIDSSTHRIQLTVAQDTDLSSLIARFETTGQFVTVNGVEQYSGVTANTYTSDLTYRVTAYDNSVQDYTVSVSESSCLEQPWQGNYRVTSAQDIQTLAGYTSVTGTLTIGGQSTGLTDVAGLECLNTVGGLTILSNPDLTNLDGLSGLKTISANLIISDNPVLTSISGLSGLTSVSNISISNNDQLTSLNGIGGVSQAHEVDVSSMLALTDLNALTHIRIINKLKLQTLPELTVLPGFTALENGLYLEITDNDGLTNLTGLEQLTQASVISISGNDGLENLVGLSGLTSATNVGLAYNYNLTSLQGLEQLNVVTSLTLQNHQRLQALTGLSGLNSIFNGITLLDNPMLSDLTALSNLTSLSGNLTVRNNDSLRDFTGMDNVSTGLSTVTIDNNDDLQNLAGLAAVPSATKIILKNNPVLVNLQGLNGLTTTSLLQLENNAALSSLAGLDALTQVNGRLAIINNDAMFSTSGAPQLQTVTGDFDVERNNQLTHLDGFNQLTSVGETTIRLNNALVNLDGMLSVTEIKGSLKLSGNNQLLDLSGLGNLTQIGTGASDDLDIRGGALDHLGLRSLARVTGDVLVDNTSLVDFDLPALCRVGQNFQVSANGALCTSKVDAIRDQVVACDGIGGTITIRDNMVCP